MARVRVPLDEAICPAGTGKATARLTLERDGGATAAVTVTLPHAVLGEINADECATRAVTDAAMPSLGSVKAASSTAVQTTLSSAASGDHCQITPLRGEAQLSQRGHQMVGSPGRPRSVPRHFFTGVLTEEGATLASALQKALTCPDHPQSRVVRDGTYGKRSLALRRCYRCFFDPIDRSKKHRFTPGLARDHVHATGAHFPNTVFVPGVWHLGQAIRTALRDAPVAHVVIAAGKTLPPDLGRTCISCAAARTPPPPRRATPAGGTNC